MIVEGVATTWDSAGRVNVAPLGAIVPDDRSPSEWTELRFRPFPGSRTYANLKEVGDGFFHLTDDVMLIAQSAVGQVAPPLVPCDYHPHGRRLADCCGWYAFYVVLFRDEGERPEAFAEIGQRGEVRPWTGFNRAKHAVLEAAILATRLHLTGKESVLQEFDRLKAPIEKTAGPAEREAFAFLVEYVKQWNEG